VFLASALMSSHQLKFTKMKKTMIAAVAVCLIGFGMASCKKSFNCECTVFASGDTTQVEGKGKDAVAACDDEDKPLQFKDCWPAE
jgi:hypothetical protein